METNVRDFFEGTRETPLESFHHQIDEALALHLKPHGRADEWDNILAKLPEPTDSEALQHPGFNQSVVTVGHPGVDLEEPLGAFKPWRKGPFQIGGTYIDTEWRSDWKWDRIIPNISDLTGRTVLDIGCGNGYHLFRMLGAGASLALGVDPTLLFNYQFAAIQKLAPKNRAYLLPLRGEQLPAFNCFDSVFSLGVLYHRRSPVDHLTELLSFLAPGGELILETLVIEGDEQSVLIPPDRYAKMANVWFIPSPDLLKILLQRAGFTDIRVADVTRTTLEEQRATKWMDFQSLADFLDPNDPGKTAEGHPGPIRAILVARKPA